jgi:hypothetical protein
VHKLALAVCIVCFEATIASCQEYGPVRSYAGAGRLYSTLVGDPVTRESYIISDRTYRSEDSYGKEGTLRYTFKYSDGQSDSALMKFFVRCKSVSSDLEVQVWASDQQQEQARASVIKDNNRTPSGIERDAYDLYRTLCSDREVGPSAPKKGEAKPRPSAEQHLRNCLADYVRRKGNFVPEGQSTAYVKSRSDMTSMCLFAIAQKNYYWEYLQRHPELGR